MSDLHLCSINVSDLHLCCRKVLLMEDSDQNIHLKNLSTQEASNEEEALNLLFLGDTNRMIAEVGIHCAYVHVYECVCTSEFSITGPNHAGLIILHFCSVLC